MMGFGLDLSPVFRAGRGGAEAYPYVTDLFIVTGQSNGEGRGDSSLSPAAPKGIYISGSTITAPLADPVGGANTGSMWPAWANEWFAQTGHRSAFVEQATGGDALVVGTADWGPSGPRRAAAAAAANSAINAINASEDYTLGSVYFVWVQGESDKAGAASYSSELQALAAYFSSEVPEMTSMLVVATAPLGIVSGFVRNLEDGWGPLRKAQSDAAENSALIDMAYAGTPAFVPLGLSDSLHYNQSGLNIAGKSAARRVAKGYPAYLAAASPSAFTPFVDPGDGAKTQRTFSHTMASGTKSIVLLVSGIRSTPPTFSATINGESLIRVGFTTVAGSGGFGRLFMFWLPESLFGSLDSAETSIVITATNCFSIHAALYEFSEELFPEGLSNSELTNVSANSADIVSLPPSQVVAGVVTDDSAGSSTTTFTGATEDADMTAFNSRHHGLATAHYTQPADDQHTIAVTHSKTVDGSAVLYMSFRRQIDGE